jgi:hypothetical protein
LSSFSASAYTVTGVLPAPFGYGGSREDLLPLVVIALTFSRLVAIGRVEANWANCNFTFLLKIIYSLTVEEKLFILALILSMILSLQASLFALLSLILTCSEIRSLKDGCLKLEEL